MCRISKCLLLLLFVLELLLVSSKTTQAQVSLGEDVHTALIVLDSGYVSTPPALDHGLMVLDAGSGKLQPSEIPGVIGFQYLYDSGTNNPPSEGPWIVTLYTSEPWPDYLDEIRAIPEVVLCESMDPADQDSIDVTLGEASKVWFPEEAMDGHGAFCEAQFYLDAPNTSEQPGPTLLDAGTDACSRYAASVGADMDLPQAWGITRGDSNIIIASMDTGVDWTHPELGGDGIPEAGATLNELLESFTNGGIFHNSREGIGDKNGDEASGQHLVNEDGDDQTDEDPTGLLYNNVTESDVVFGKWTSAELLTLNDANATWDPNEVVGEYVVVFANFIPTYRDSIIAATDTSITVANISPYPLIDFGTYLAAVPDSTYMISDGEDTDLDGVRDDWWDYDPSDDDEDGFPDDIKGWCTWYAYGVAPPRPDYVHTRVVYGTNDTRPTDGEEIAPHGTGVAGIIAAQANGLGVVGVAPDCRLQPYKVLAQDGVPFSDAGLAAAINHVRKLNDENGTHLVNVITLSLGIDGPGTPVRSGWECGTFAEKDGAGRYINPIAAQLDSAMTEGIVVVAASGNTDSLVTEPYFVHCLPGVISVGGTTGRRPWSGVGASRGYGMTYGPWVDISAPAENVATTAPFCSSGYCDNGYGVVNQGEHGWNFYNWGTSFAAPIVAGAAGLMLSVNPNLTPEQLKAKLLASVDPIDYSGLEGLIGNAGTGKINFYKALTNYGDIPAAALDTTWTDTVWISGDMHTASDKELHILPGTVIKIAQDDLLGAGENGSRIEWRIEGAVDAATTPGNPTIFEVHTDSPDSLWGPIGIVESFQSQSMDFLNVEFRGLVHDHITTALNGAKLLVNVPTTIEWSTDWIETGGANSVPYELTVDLEYSKDGGQNYTTIATGVSATLGSYVWSPSASDAQIYDGKIRITFKGSHNLVIGSEESPGSFSVLNSNGLTYVNKSLDPDSNPILNYEGRPYSSVSFDYDGDGKQDLFVTQRDKRAQLYQNTGNRANKAPYLENRTSTAFGSDRPGQDLHGAAFTDFDKDGNIDLFVAATKTTDGDQARLYRNNGDDTFTDIADDLGLTSIFEDSWTGAWGDYDGDMRPDLFVGRGGSVQGVSYDQYPALLAARKPKLLHNVSQSGDPAFEDVSGWMQTGIEKYTGDPGLPCVAATWGDVDGDGDLDLVAGSTAIPLLGESASRLYIQDDNGYFGDQWFSHMGYNLGGVCSLELANMQEANSSTPDLVLGILIPGYSQPSVYWNDGVGNFGSQVALQSGMVPSSVQVIDFGNTGRYDILVLPDSTSGAGEAPKLYLNVDDGGSTPTFVECGVEAGLSETGGVYSFASADFDGDSNKDLFLGRRVDSHAFYYRMESYGQGGQGGGQGIRVRLAGSGGNDAMGLGASVTLLINGVEQQRQVVSGGDGRGGQHSAELVFGLGDYSTGTIEARVDWSDGWSQTDTLSTSGLNVITDSSPVNLLANTVTESNLIDGSLTVTWTFTWETEYASDPALDTVYVTPTGGCGTSWTLRYDSPVVDHEITRLADGHFQHKLIAHERPCIVMCYYSYYCESANNLVVSNNQANPKTFKTKFCAQ